MEKSKNDQELLKQYGKTARKVLDIIEKGRKEKGPDDKRPADRESEKER